MNLEKLKNVLAGEPSFRLKQAREAIFTNLITDWNQASNFPLALRQRLAKNFPLEIKAKLFWDKDKTSAKAVITLVDGLEVETVLLRHSKDKNRNTVCLSSQVGCPLACSFCATGQMGFKRNLETGEIIEQVLFFSRLLKEKEQKVNSIVFMGMGEPMLNFANVVAAIKMLNDKNAFNIGARHISLSTVGLEGAIKKITDLPYQINLAFSLHAPNNKLRSEIIPSNIAYPLDKLIKDLVDYTKKTKRRVMIEYIMIDNFNDSAEQAEELIKLLVPLEKNLYFVNLISYNPTQKFQPSPPAKIKVFRKILERQSIGVTERYRFGREIKGACGQLTITN